MQRYLNPTWRLLDALPPVVGPPALHEAEAEDTQTAQIIHTNSLGHVGLDADVGSSHVPCTHTHIIYNQQQKKLKGKISHRFFISICKREGGNGEQLEGEMGERLEEMEEC